MRVVYLNFDRGIPVCGSKGGSVHVRAVVSALARLGHDVTLLCSTAGAGNAPPPGRLIELPPPPGPLAATECRRLGLPEEALADRLVQRELGVLAHDRGLAGRALAALAAHGIRPDLIYERHALFHVAGIAIAAAFGIPRVLEVNAPLAEEQERFRGLALRDLAAGREAHSWRSASLAVAVSEDVAVRLRAAGVAAAHLLVGQNGVDTTLFCGAGDGGAAVRRRLGLGDDPVIGFIGSFKPWHGMAFLLDAFATLAARRPDARLLAVGEGPELPAVAGRVAALGLGDRVLLPGRVAHAEVPAWLAAMDLTVAPYLPQPDFYFSPLKLFESFAAARPVVAPRLGQIGELIAPGQTGLLYDAGDAAGCLAALEALLDDPAQCRAMGQEARRQVAARGWDHTVARILALAPASPQAARARELAS